MGSTQWKRLPIHRLMSNHVSPGQVCPPMAGGGGSIVNLGKQDKWRRRRRKEQKTFNLPLPPFLRRILPFLLRQRNRHLLSSLACYLGFPAYHAKKLFLPALSIRFLWKHFTVATKQQSTICKKIKLKTYDEFILNTYLEEGRNEVCRPNRHEGLVLELLLRAPRHVALQVQLLVSAVLAVVGVDAPGNSNYFMGNVLFL